MKQTLVLLPGMLADAAFWRAPVTRLADSCEPVVVDYGLADRIEAMAAIALAAAPPRFALAGHSMGGRVALEMVKRAPGRVTGLAFVCTDYRGPAQNASDWRELEETARNGGMRAAGKFLLGHLIAPERLADEALVGEVIDMVARQSPERLAAHIHAGRTRPDYSDLLAKIACPTLVCAGEKDALRPVERHAEMAALIPGAQLAVIAGSGHMVAMEQPSALAGALRPWLSRCSA